MGGYDWWEDGLTMKVLLHNHNYKGQIPFKLKLKIYYTYYPPTVCISEPYYIDECVICLSNKPDILFAHCLHHCVCLECEKIAPFERCPYCKSIIAMKIKI